MSLEEKTEYSFIQSDGKVGYCSGNQLICECEQCVVNRECTRNEYTCSCKWCLYMTTCECCGKHKPGEVTQTNRL